MLKKILESLDSLSEELKKFYKKGDDDKFYLQVEGGMGEGGEELATLRNAKDHEKNLRVAAEQARDAAQAQATTLTEERDTAVSERDTARAEKGTDVQTLEASWQKKLDDAKAESDGKIGKLTNELKRVLVTKQAAALAAEISTVPDLLESVIASRLQVEEGAEGEHFARVLDADGNPSAATIDDLRKELLANKKYAPIMIGSKGTGGGAGDPGSGGGADDKKGFMDYSDQELSEMRTEDPEKYKRLKDAMDAGT